VTLATARRRAKALVAFIVVSAASSLAFGAPLPEGDIRDIRGPIAIPPWWRWPLAVSLAALAALAVVLLVRWWRLRSARPLSPLELARRALTVAEAHAREGRSHEWAEVVAETTRGALARRVGAEILPLTTSELWKAGWAKPPLCDEVDAAQVLTLLDTCDLARFAKARLETSELLASTALARECTERLYAPPPKPSNTPATPAETVTP